MTPEQLAEVVSMEGAGYIFTIERPDGSREDHCRSEVYMMNPKDKPAYIRSFEDATFVPNPDFKDSPIMQLDPFSDEATDRIIRQGYEHGILDAPLSENPESSEEVKRYMRVQGQLAGHPDFL